MSALRESLRGTECADNNKTSCKTTTYFLNTSKTTLGMRKLSTDTHSYRLVCPAHTCTARGEKGAFWRHDNKIQTQNNIQEGNQQTAPSQRRRHFTIKVLTCFVLKMFIEKYIVTPRNTDITV